MKTCLSVEEGCELLLEKCEELPWEEVLIEDACGRILAETIYSPENIPPFARSPLDGYAFRHEDTLAASKDHPVHLRIVEEIPAGKAPEHMIHAGEAAHIMTGGPIPQGADAVEKFEKLEVTGDEICLRSSYSSGKNVVPVGEEIKAGELVLEKGERISPAYQGVLAGLGFVTVKVVRKPLVSLISTGSELVAVSEKLTPGKIRNSSIYTLKGFLEKAGCRVKMEPIVKDDEALIVAKVKEAAKFSDLVITTGGVSVGDYDLLIPAMKSLGAELLYWKLDMKPGMAFLASMLGAKPVISLSGNPSAAVMSLLMVAIPLVKKMSGCASFYYRKVKLGLKGGFKNKNRMKRYVPGRVSIDEEGEVMMLIAARQSNGILHPLHECDAIAYIPNDKEEIADGEKVEVYLL